MRRRSRGERTPLNADINVVSLIDVMMLLMVIFMITAPMMQGGVDISLPRAEARPLQASYAPPIAPAQTALHLTPSSATRSAITIGIPCVKTLGFSPDAGERVK